MEFNIHPILIHFPIAFLVGYTFVEHARFTFLTRQAYYHSIKLFLLFGGVLTAIPAILAGLIAKQYISDQSLVNIHETINLTAFSIFTLLAICYLVAWLDHNSSKSSKKIWLRPASKAAKVIINTPIVFVLALLAVGLLSTGAAIGGLIVYGPNSDPFTHLLASFLGIK